VHRLLLIILGFFMLKVSWNLTCVLVIAHGFFRSALIVRANLRVQYQIRWIFIFVSVFTILMGNLSVLLRIIVDRNWFLALFNLWLSFVYFILMIIFWWCVKQLRTHIFAIEYAVRGLSNNTNKAGKHNFRGFLILLFLGSVWSCVAIGLQIQISVQWLGKRSDPFFRLHEIDDWRPDFFSYLQCVFVLLFIYYSWIPFPCCVKGAKEKKIVSHAPNPYQYQQIERQEQIGGDLVRNNLSELSELPNSQSALLLGDSEIPRGSIVEDYFQEKNCNSESSNSPLLSRGQNFPSY